MLAGWTSEQLLDYAVDSWMWGERCHVANMLNEQYFLCTLKNDEKACETYQELLKRIRERETQPQ